MFSEFDERTAANMEIALQRACGQLGRELAEDHKVRSQIAKAILSSAHSGHTKLADLTAAGRHAAMKIAANSAPPTSLAS